MTYPPNAVWIAFSVGVFIGIFFTFFIIGIVELIKDHYKNRIR